MATATKNLENDHVSILRLIDVLEKMIVKQGTNVEHFEMVVDIIKGYADGFHHAKEENLLFPLMVTKGYSTENGPIAVMLHDHIEGRSYVKGMVKGISDFSSNPTTALTNIYDNGKGYIALLRAHIGKENNVLFRMADNVFSPEDQNQLLLEFAKIEQSESYSKAINHWLANIEKLETVYNQ